MGDSSVASHRTFRVMAGAPHGAVIVGHRLIEEAAALWESLAQNHPFIDGNKRTAFAVTYTFLAINGGRITAEALPTHKFIIGLYEAGTFDFEHLTAWLRNNVSPE